MSVEWEFWSDAGRFRHAPPGTDLYRRSKDLPPGGPKVAVHAAEFRLLIGDRCEWANGIVLNVGSLEEAFKAADVILRLRGDV